MNSQSIALVTGAAKGIGLAITERLLEDGYFVLGADKDIEWGTLSAHKYDPATFSFVHLDVCNEEMVH